MTSSIPPSFQWFLGRLLSSMNTMSPILMFLAGFLHRWRHCRSWMYSHFQRLQNCSVNWTLPHLFRLYTSSLRNCPGGGSTIDDFMRSKWFGVIGVSPVGSFSGECYAVHNSRDFCHDCSEDIIKLLCTIIYQGCEHTTYCVNLSFPYTTLMTSVRWAELKFPFIVSQVVTNLFISYFLNSTRELCHTECAVQYLWDWWNVSTHWWRHLWTMMLPLPSE